MLASNLGKIKQSLDKLQLELWCSKVHWLVFFFFGVMSIILFSLLFHIFSHWTGCRFGDRHLKVPKTAKTHFSGKLPGKGINWSSMCKHEEEASVGLPNIPLRVPAPCILLYRPKLKKCVQMQVWRSSSFVL